MYFILLVFVRIEYSFSFKNDGVQKGVCLSPANFMRGDIEALGNIAWYYDWHYTNR